MVDENTADAEPDDNKPAAQPDNSEELASLRAALQRANRESADRRKKLEAWDRLERSPEELAELLEAQRKAEEDKATKAGEWDKLRAQLSANHEAVVSKLNEQLATERKARERYLIDSQATAAIAAAKGVPELLLPIVQRQLRVQEKDGSFVLEVVDASGQPRVSGTKGDPMSISDLVAEMRASEVYGRAFDGAGQSGGGTQPVNGGGVSPKVSYDDLQKDRRARAAFIEQHGAEAYFKLNPNLR